MTNSYFNAAPGAAATPAPTFSSHVSTVDAPNSASAATNSAPRAPIAPWVQSGFVAIPTEFFRVAISQLSKRAQSLYFLHCSHANARGENAGLSYCYRETLARELNCSLDTVDRANLELEKYGLIEDAGRRYQHGGAVVYRLNPPAKWKLDAPKSPKRTPRKTAALKPQSCGEGAATLRPITRDTKQLKAKEQQTAPIEKPNLGVNEADVVVEKNQNSVETPQTPSAEELRVSAALERCGFTPSMAERLMVEHGAQACAYQLQRLEQQNHVKTPTGWMIRALQRDDRDAVAAVAPVAPQPSAQDKAERATRMKERAERDEAAAARVFAGLDFKRQAYLNRCMELEGLSLVEVIKREEHYALSRCVLA